MEKSEELNFLSALWPFIGIVFLIVLGVLLLTSQFNKKLLRQKLEKEKIKAQLQLEMLRSNIAAQENERKRIARDLHDELGAALSMTRMHLVQLEQQNSSDTKLNEQLKTVRNMTENALSSMRRISHELMPPQLESFGLVKTLQSTASEINQLEHLQIIIDAGERNERPPMPVEIGLYRVCMELINNTIRHAQASRISITLDISDTKIKLIYRDNGKGLAAGELKKGIGHQSIETRIHSLGGNFSIQNHGEGGIIARIELDFFGNNPSNTNS